MRVGDFDFDKVLLDKTSYENILISDISQKTFMGGKPLCIRINKVDEFIKTYDGTTYLV